jgi:hypothetical protein
MNWVQPTLDPYVQRPPTIVQLKKSRVVGWVPCDASTTENLGMLVPGARLAVNRLYGVDGKHRPGFLICHSRARRGYHGKRALGGTRVRCDVATHGE